MRQKILSLLVLLLTAATGAWATDEVLLTTVTATSLTTYSQSPDGMVTVTISDIDNYLVEYGWSRFASGTATVTVEAAEGYTITRCVFKQAPSSKPNRVLEDDKTPFVMTINGGGMFSIPSSSVEASDGQRNVTEMDGASVIEVYGYAGTPEPAEPDVEVTTNAASEGATFTEASFQMPAFDATADYELVRDMTYQVNAYVGTTPDADYRHRVEKVDATTYWPVDITEEAQIIALFPVIDIIDAQNPKTLTYGTDYTLAIVDEQENEIDPADFNFAPGTYTVKVTGKGDYDGQIESLNKFELYFGYELTVGPGEFATFYKDEALTLDENETEAQLYTITAVGTETATATELTIAAANTPILVKNTSEEAKTILLIPTVDDADEVTAAEEFVGTLEATTIAASTEALNNYALNGKQFVWVMNAIEVAANKCWLQIPSGEVTARNITLVFGDATGVNGVIGVKEVNDDSWYDLNGRKVTKPTKKGIYILNGKKVVVK